MVIVFEKVNEMLIKVSTCNMAKIWTGRIIFHE